MYVYRYVYAMATKTITITEDVFDRLHALKREDESVSDLLSRLSEQEDLMAYAGSCPGLGSAVQEAKAELESDRDEKHHELFG